MSSVAPTSAQLSTILAGPSTSGLHLSPAFAHVPHHISEKVASLRVPNIDEWLSDRLTYEQQVMYGVLMGARYTSLEAFPVSFDKLWSTLQYAHKHKATELLLKFYVEGTDFEVFQDVPENSGRGGRPVNSYALTVDAAQRFAMRAATEKGEEVRAFFVAAMAALQDYHVLTLLAAERQRSLQEQHDLLIRQYRGRSVWYLVLIEHRDGYDMYKAGHTDDLHNRAGGWKHDFGQCYLRYVIQSPLAKKLETAFENHPRARRQRFSEMVNGRNQTELYRITDKFTEKLAMTIAKTLFKKLTIASNVDPLHKEKLQELATREVEAKEKTRRTKEKTKQLRLKIQLLRLRQGLPTSAGEDVSDSDEGEPFEESSDDDSIAEAETPSEETEWKPVGPRDAQTFRRKHVVADDDATLSMKALVNEFKVWAPMNKRQLPTGVGAPKMLKKLFIDILGPVYKNSWHGKHLTGWFKLRLVPVEQPQSASQPSTEDTGLSVVEPDQPEESSEDEAVQRP